MNKFTLAILFGLVAYTNACDKCGHGKPQHTDDDDDNVGAPNPSNPSPYNVWADFAVRWQEI